MNVVFLHKRGASIIGPALVQSRDEFDFGFVQSNSQLVDISLYGYGLLLNIFQMPFDVAKARNDIGQIVNGNCFGDLSKVTFQNGARVVENFVQTSFQLIKVCYLKMS